MAYYQSTDSAHSAYKNYGPFVYAILISGLLVLNTLYTHNLAQLVSEYSLKIRTAVCSLIYRKALRLRPDSFEDISIGKWSLNNGETRSKGFLDFRENYNPNIKGCFCHRRCFDIPQRYGNRNFTFTSCYLFTIRQSWGCCLTSSSGYGACCSFSR